MCEKGTLLISVSVHSLHVTYTLAFIGRQFQGGNSSRRLAGWPSVMRCRTSLSQAKGSTLLSFAVAMREQMVAHRTPPPSEPANRGFLRDRLAGEHFSLQGIVLLRALERTGHVLCRPLLGVWHHSGLDLIYDRHRCVEAEKAKAPRKIDISAVEDALLG